MAEVATGTPEPVKQAETVGSVPPDIATRTRRTQELIAAQKAEALANAPEGRLPSAPRKTNKLVPTDVIGQGGWHWYQGQMGPQKAEEEWLHQFGRTNQSYNDVRQAAKEGRLALPDIVEGKKGGSNPREATVPNYIKGGATPEMLGMIAGNTLGGIELFKQYKKAKESGDWSDFGLGVANQLAANVLPKAGGLGIALMNPGNLGQSPEDLKAFGERLQKAQQAFKVGAGRGSIGVPPP